MFETLAEGQSRQKRRKEEKARKLCEIAIYFCDFTGRRSPVGSSTNNKGCQSLPGAVQCVRREHRTEG